MPFQALTQSPMLRDGTILNIMATPQTLGSAPPVTLLPGTALTIRFGHCCPDIVEATIAEPPLPCSSRAILRLNGTDWTIERDLESRGVDIPGIVSETWAVRIGPAD
jgi:hypothetical protein